MRPWLLMLVAACGKVNAVAVDAAPPHALTVVVGGSATSSVTITSDVGGISCGTSCRDTFDAGTVVTLTATPAGTARWSGACTGTDSCVVTLTEDITVTASTC